jgi:CheY-like chemotaxis protein
MVTVADLKKEMSLNESLSPHLPDGIEHLEILVADDSPINQKIISYMLDKLGLQADFAPNGALAIGMLEEKKYDVIFMDIQMPEMNGIEATREIRSRNLGHPYIIAMTAGIMEEDRIESFAAGMNDYITKPVNLADLRHLLQRFIASRGYQK